jgi:hypothetical protein
MSVTEIIPVFLLLFIYTTPTRSSQTARGNRSYRRAYLAVSGADGPEAEVLDGLDGPTALKHTSLL